MPSFRELKAFLVSERQVTLICDDERFIMLQRGAFGDGEVLIRVPRFCD